MTQLYTYIHFSSYFVLSIRVWTRKWQPTPEFLPAHSHGQKSLVGYGPEGHKESDTTEVTKHAWFIPGGWI